MDFELVILTIERDIEKLAFGMPLLRGFLAPARTVFVASADCLASLKRAGIPQGGDLMLDEDAIFEGLTLAQVRGLLHDRGADPRRAGWYFKQLLIFAYATLEGAADRYLVWDADTIPLRRLSFLDAQGKAIFDVATDLNEAYFETMRSMLGIGRQVDYSFISDHMMLEKRIALALLDRIMGGQPLKGEELAKRALASISEQGLSGGCGFSEYESYGNFAALYFPDSFTVRASSRTRQGSRLFGLPPSKAGLFAASRKYAWANFESLAGAEHGLRQRFKYVTYRSIGILWSALAVILHPKAFAAFPGPASAGT